MLGVIVASLAALSHAAAAKDVAAAPGQSPSPPPAVADPAKQIDVVEGVDYAYQAHVNGLPVRWPCTATIPVAIEGTVPAGADAAVVAAVDVLRDASGLPLQVSHASEITESEKGAIRIRYVDSGHQVYGMSVSETTLGRGGPTYDTEGTIVSGHVIIRDDIDPKIPLFDQVLLHELAHALGLGHAEQGQPELMAPAASASSQATLGRGDRFALRSIGCNAPRP